MLSLTNSDSEVGAISSRKSSFVPVCSDVRKTHLFVSVEKDPPQRRGLKGYFKGSRKVFLEGQLPKYNACKKGNRQSFWHQLYSAWWICYPWRLNNDDEPPTGDFVKMARLAAVAPGDEEEKKGIEQRLTEVRSGSRVFVAGR